MGRLHTPPIVSLQWRGHARFRVRENVKKKAAPRLIAPTGEGYFEAPRSGLAPLGCPEDEPDHLVFGQPGAFVQQGLLDPDARRSRRWVNPCFGAIQGATTVHSNVVQRHDPASLGDRNMEDLGHLGHNAEQPQCRRTAGGRASPCVQERCPHLLSRIDRPGESGIDTWVDALPTTVVDVGDGFRAREPESDQLPAADESALFVGDGAPQRVGGDLAHQHDKDVDGSGGAIPGCPHFGRHRRGWVRRHGELSTFRGASRRCRARSPG